MAWRAGRLAKKPLPSLGVGVKRWLADAREHGVTLCQSPRANPVSVWVRQVVPAARGTRWGCLACRWGGGAFRGLAFAREVTRADRGETRRCGIRSDRTLAPRLERGRAGRRCRPTPPKCRRPSCCSVTSLLPSSTSSRPPGASRHGRCYGYGGVGRAMERLAHGKRVRNQSTPVGARSLCRKRPQTMGLAQGLIQISPRILGGGPVSGTAGTIGGRFLGGGGFSAVGQPRGARCESS